MKEQINTAAKQPREKRGKLRSKAVAGETCLTSVGLLFAKTCPASVGLLFAKLWDGPPLRRASNPTATTALPLYCSTVLSFLLLTTIGCGPNYEFKRAARLSQKGRYVDSAVAYEKFYKRYPSHNLSPLALLNSAEIYNYKIRLPSKAASLYHTVISNFPTYSEYVEKAKNGLVKSPDYFPLKNNSTWIEGDSATRGSNMKAEWKITEVSTGVFFMSKKFMSGGKVVAQTNHYFKYDGYSIMEMPSARGATGWIFLQYPIMQNKRWRIVGRGGRSATLWIDGVGLKVNVAAGNFDDCIRVAKKFDDMPNVIKYNYYAPYVGWLLTTVSSGGREHRNSELISYKIPE